MSNSKSLNLRKLKTVNLIRKTFVKFSHQKRKHIIQKRENASWVNLQTMKKKTFYIKFIRAIGFIKKRIF